MGESSLAVRLGLPRWNAYALRQAHRRTYTQFWSWSDAVVADAAHTGYIRTAGGWWMYVGKKVPVRTLRNFLMQAHGSDLLRVAVVLLDRLGVEVIATVHDALLIEADVHDIDRAVMLTKAAMRAASRIVLDGFELRVESKIVRYPDRFTDARGTRMWETVNTLLADILRERCA